MCCSSTGYSENEIDGECQDCGQATVEGDAFEACSYSPIECELCGWAPCDGAC